ncbi:hypothetical protein P692DRAFT_20813209 [Suillus brevipes Sb2]|nr:hypothetical protein P692DRAFT_20813209 [Suillus brevipes Sb2]
MGHSYPETTDEANEIILLASRDVMGEAGVYPYTRLRRVKTPQGSFWCIAFASTDPREQLSTSAPPEEQYKALKEVLEKKSAPRWFEADN